MDTKMQDSALIEDFLSGDNRAFEQLVKRHQNRVLNIVTSLTGRRYDAEDIAQEVFIKVYKNLAYFKRRAEFSTWLYRITVNTTYNYLKSQKRLIPDTSVEQELVSPEGPRRELEAQETGQLVRRALERLPFKLRTVVVLKDIQGLSYREISRSLGCRVGTVESRLFRARQALKRILAPLIKEPQDAGGER